MAKGYTRVEVPMSPELKARVEEEAALSEDSVAGVVRRAVFAYLDDRETGRRPRPVDGAYARP